MLSVLNTYFLRVRQKHTVTIRLQDNIRLIHIVIYHRLDTSNSRFPDTLTQIHTQNTT